MVLFLGATDSSKESHPLLEKCQRSSRGDGAGGTGPQADSVWKRIWADSSMIRVLCFYFENFKPTENFQNSTINS